jgi:hypothetical protein
MPYEVRLWKIGRFPEGFFQAGTHEFHQSFPVPQGASYNKIPVKHLPEQTEVDGSIHDSGPQEFLCRMNTSSLNYLLNIKLKGCITKSLVPDVLAAQE